MKAKIYTKTGDKGETSLVGGTRVTKTHRRLEAYGTLDELNSVLGILRSQLRGTTPLADFLPQIDTTLQSIQNNLFNVGSHLACEDQTLRLKLPHLSVGLVPVLEKQMDTWETRLPPLRNFILPGGSPVAAYAHLGRTVCRRAEREALRLAEEAPVDSEHIVFLNRLSDWLFLLARELNHQLHLDDSIWDKG